MGPDPSQWFDIGSNSSLQTPAPASTPPSNMVVKRSWCSPSLQDFFEDKSRRHIPFFVGLLNDLL